MFGTIVRTGFEIVNFKSGTAIKGACTMIQIVIVLALLVPDFLPIINLA